MCIYSYNCSLIINGCTGVLFQIQRRNGHNLFLGHSIRIVTIFLENKFLYNLLNILTLRLVKCVSTLFYTYGPDRTESFIYSILHGLWRQFIGQRNLKIAVITRNVKTSVLSQRLVLFLSHLNGGIHKRLHLYKYFSQIQY